MAFISYAIGCIFKHSKTSKYVYYLLIYYEIKSHQPQFIKNINGVKSLVDEIFHINEQCPFAQHENDYKLQFFVHSCENADQNKRKREMRNQTVKQSYNEMEP